MSKLKRDPLIEGLCLIVTIAGCRAATIHQVIRNNQYKKVKQILDDVPSLVNVREQSKETDGAEPRHQAAGWSPLDEGMQVGALKIEKMIREARKTNPKTKLFAS